MSNWQFMRARWNERLRNTWALYSVRLDDLPVLVQKYLAGPISRHPEVRFDLLFLPTSALDYVNDFQVSWDRLAKRLALRRAVGHTLGPLPNVTLWDFQLDWSLTTDLDRFRDLEHFDEATALRILSDMKADKNRVSGEKLELRNHELEQRIVRYAWEFCDGEDDRCQPALIRNLKRYSDFLK
jgi:hypothetical protein